MRNQHKLVSPAGNKKNGKAPLVGVVLLLHAGVCQLKSLFFRVF